MFNTFEQFFNILLGIVSFVTQVKPLNTPDNWVVLAATSPWNIFSILDNVIVTEPLNGEVIELNIGI